MIEAHNKFASEHGFEMGVNQFMDITNAEFTATYLSYKPRKSSKGEEFVSKGLTIPTNVNWTAQGDVTPVKN
jgi:hypothetical protein